MTLIVTCLTPSWTVQVSDRRLVKVSDNSMSVAEEEANKAIVYRDNFAVGYTGLARIGGIPTDEWIALQLAGQRDVESGIEWLAEAATREFTQMRGIPASARRHAFVVAGFAYVDQTSGPVPVVVRVSNALDSRGRWQDRAQPRFTEVARCLPPGARFAIICTGQSLRSDTATWLSRWVRRATERDAGPYAVTKLIARAIWETADRNKAVGRSLMAVGVVPDEVPGLSGHVWNSYPQRDKPTFLYFNRAGRNNPQQGPLVVGRAGIVKDIRIHRL
jgi:hypothetical protein